MGLRTLRKMGIMKSMLFVSFLAFLNIKTSFLPKADLLVIMGIAMVVDFITGIIKAIVLHQKRTPEAYMKTVTKFIQYGVSILVAMGISYMGSQIEAYNPNWKNISVAMNWLNNGLLILIIFIEIVSILENVNNMNKRSTFAKNVIQPALRILTIQIRNNPIATLTLEAEDTEDEIQIKEEIVTSKNFTK